MFLLAAATLLAGIDGVGAAGGSVRDLAWNPAAAIGANGADAWASDTVQLVFLSYQRAPYVGTNPSTDPSRTFPQDDTLIYGHVPYAAVRWDKLLDQDRQAPKGDRSVFGVGFSLHVPTGSAIVYPEDGPGRYHIIWGTSYAAYLSPVAAWRPLPNLRVGAGPSLVIGHLSVRKAIDLAPDLLAITGPPAPAPEQGALEGRFEVDDANGLSGTWTVGALWEPTPGLTLGLSYLAPCNVTISGRSSYVPSLDFNVASSADFSVDKHLPPFVNLGARWLARPDLSLYLEGQWVGWSRNHDSQVHLRNAEIHATNAELQSFLNSLGLTPAAQSQLVARIFNRDLDSVNGDRDTGNAVLGGELSRPPFLLRLELGYFRSSVPPEYLTPAELDFDSFILGIGVRWAIDRRWRVGLTLDQFFTAGTTVDSSAFSPNAAPDSGLDLPTGNGRYDAVLTRITLSGGVRF